MNHFKRVSAAALAGATLALASVTSHGMGFGRPVSSAVLGEPLRVSVPLRLEAGESLDTECLSVTVLYGDEALSPAQVQVSLVGGSGRESSVQIRTTVAINEPIVTYELMAGCPAKVRRQFVALADPPSMSLSHVATPVGDGALEPSAEARPAATRPVAGVSQDGVTAASAVRTDARSNRRVQARTSGAARATPRTTPVRKVTAADEAPVQRTSLSLTPKVTSSAAGRLELDPVEADATVKPDLRMSGSLSNLTSVDDGAPPEALERRAAAAALWQAMNLTPEEIARDRQKLLAQERMLAQIQAQATLSGASQAGAESGVLTSPPQSERSWLLYTMGVLALFGLGLCVALFLKLRRRQQAEAAWWQSQMQEPVSEAPASGQTPVQPERAVEAASPVDTVSTPAPVVKPIESAAPAAVKPAQTAAPVHAFRHPAAEVMREVSVEELIDLEQQAEFFVVLGQDDAAVDLLESHVHSVTASPLPYLKLLEIYQRLGRHADYERVQAEFNERFNAHAPAWEADLQHGHELADYPGVVERLQTLWPSPAKAMEVLEKSLTRPESESDTFELPAYRELLFLYAVARDLSEREQGDRPRVDLLAAEPAAHPHGQAPFDLSAHEGNVIEPLMATRPVKAVPDVQPTISLDLQLDDLTVDDKPASSYGDVMVSGKAAAANDQDVEHIDLPGMAESEAAPRNAHKP